MGGLRHYRKASDQFNESPLLDGSKPVEQQSSFEEEYDDSEEE